MARVADPERRRALVRTALGVARKEGLQSATIHAILEDGEGRTVWTARLERTTTRLALPPELAGTLEPGRPYLWRIAAELPGEERVEGGSLAFVPR